MNLFKLRPTHNYLPFHSSQCHSVIAAALNIMNATQTILKNTPVNLPQSRLVPQSELET